MSYQYRDAQGNPYVRGWGHDFTDAEKKELGIGQYRADGPAPGRTNSSLAKRIEDLLSSLPTSTGWPEGGTTIKDPRTPYPEAPGRTNPEDWITDGPAPGSGYADVQPDPTFTGEDWLNQQLPSGGSGTPPMQTPPADVPTPPLEKTLAQRVWERDQKKRVPDEYGRLYPDKNDPDFLDPRITKEGFKTMQYIPELDDPNWTPWGGRSTLADRLSPLGGGEGIQYRL